MLLLDLGLAVVFDDDALLAMKIPIVLIKFPNLRY